MAPGEWVAPEAYKYAGPAGWRMVLHAFRRVQRMPEGKRVEFWLPSHVAFLWKAKKDRAHITSHRGITKAKVQRKTYERSFSGRYDLWVAKGLGNCPKYRY